MPQELEPLNPERFGLETPRPDLESVPDATIQQFGDTVLQGAVSEGTTEPIDSPPTVHKRKAGKHKGTVPPPPTPKPAKQGRGHPMKQTKAHLSQMGKLNARQPMSAEQKRLRRKKRRR